MHRARSSVAQTHNRSSQRALSTKADEKLVSADVCETQLRLLQVDPNLHDPLFVEKDVQLDDFASLQEAHAENKALREQLSLAQRDRDAAQVRCEIQDVSSPARI